MTCLICGYCNILCFATYIQVHSLDKFALFSYLALRYRVSSLARSYRGEEGLAYPSLNLEFLLLIGRMKSSGGGGIKMIPKAYGGRYHHNLVLGHLF
ncbi:hypothetical protein L1987_02573 [Smallanthus sonchifolius]|uniref:Uncharacterized protein n=1 Tax=Smallanthus sonchifolius TaxID=185202 RepID=A0ACB9K878_9ASTR|nr:hypothetical protein L1987_02573 [Smallanthus sonchifolius]